MQREQESRVSVKSSFSRRRQQQLVNYLISQMNMDAELAHIFLRLHHANTLSEILDLFLTDQQELANHYFIPPDSHLDVCQVCQQAAIKHRQINNLFVENQQALQKQQMLRFSSLIEQPQSSKRQTCEICYIQVLQSDMVQIKEVIHNICLQCMDSYIREEINSMRIQKIACPHCNIAISPELIRELIDTPTYNKYRLFLRNLQIQKSPNLKWCPNPKCSVVVSTNSKKKTSKCPKCATEICNKCNRQAHPRSSCDGAFEKQIKGWENASDIQKCKKCQGLVQKIAGCNHMTCSICHYEWCWLCGSSYTTAHFSALNPFGCPGLQDRPRDDWGKCKIFLLRLGLLFLFILAVPLLLPLAMISGGPVFVGNMIWNCLYPQSCCKKFGIVILSIFVGILANPFVWIFCIVYFLPKGIKKAYYWLKDRRQVERRRQSFLQQRLLGQQVFQEQKLMEK